MVLLLGGLFCREFFDLFAQFVDLALQRRPLDGRSLARVLWRYPAMTAQVVAAIHWQALRLWLKRNPVHDHPRPPGVAEQEPSR